MRRSVGGEAAERLRTLPLGAHAPAATGLVGEDDGVHEPLEEVALVRGRGAPGRLERLVGLEVVALPG
jgi:hypothetical protein